MTGVGGGAWEGGGGGGAKAVDGGVGGGLAGRARHGGGDGGAWGGKSRGGARRRPFLQCAQLGCVWHGTVRRCDRADRPWHTTWVGNAAAAAAQLVAHEAAAAAGWHPVVSGPPGGGGGGRRLRVPLSPLWGTAAMAEQSWRRFGPRGQTTWVALCSTHSQGATIRGAGDGRPRWEQALCRSGLIGQPDAPRRSGRSVSTHMPRGAPHVQTVQKSSTTRPVHL